MKQIYPGKPQLFPSNKALPPRVKDGSIIFKLPLFKQLTWLISFFFISFSAFSQPTPTITYNLSQGTITIQLLQYQGNRGQCSANFYDADLEFSTDGANYQGFCAFRHSKAPNTDCGGWGPTVYGINGYYPSINAVLSSDGYQVNTTVVLELTTATQGIKNIRLKGNWWYEHSDDGRSSPVAVNNIQAVNVVKMTPINDPTFQFLVKDSLGYAEIKYTKNTLNDVDDISHMWLTDENGTFLGEFGSLAGTSGVYTVPLKTFDKTYYVAQGAYGSQFSPRILNRKPITIPAFTFPNNVSASYDTTTHEASFYWSIVPVTSGSYDKSKFKVQVADNPAFDQAKNISVDYVATQQTYLYKVTKDFPQHLYFRVSRDKTGFDWEIAKKADVAVIFRNIPQTPTASSARLQSDNTALITWDTSRGAWLPGSTFIIAKTNHTTNNAPTEFRLTEADFMKGRFVDNLLALCNKYTYTLQVVPPIGSAFTPFSPIQIADEILPVDIGTVTKLSVSKGYFADRTELNWSSKGLFDNFIIKRAPYGTSNYIQVGNVAGGPAGDYQAEDAKGTPGTYYTYMIFGTVKCGTVPVNSRDTLYAIGFRSPTGNINGRITYENGQAVENASVRLEAKDAAQLGQSIFLSGSTSSYLKVDSLHVPFNDSAFTIEGWIKPTDSLPKNQVIFSREPQYELGFDAAGLLYFSYKGQSVTGQYIDSNKTFIHIAGVHSKDSLKIVVNDSVIGSVANTFTPTANVQKGLYLGRNSTGKNFKGYIDEIRAWNVPLSTELITRDYARMLPGEETGLAAYWRFDETIKTEFYDLSHKNDQYNQNDGVIGDSAVHSNVIPTADQLSLKGITNSSGDYLISGIPYVGNGTAYSVVPRLGTHQFDPVSVSRFVSSSSNQFTVDFKDKSSFPVSGYVYYSNSTVPVVGVQFKIDGKLVIESNGSVPQTDDAGKFTISVPVGTHEVRAVKTGHVFENGGKITNSSGADLNYQVPVVGRVLLDSTTVRFIGRVAGGAVQESLPLGHSISTNNLGKSLSITMLLLTGNKYELYSGNPPGSEKAVVVKHLLPSNESDSAKIHKTTVVYQTHSIVIHPDSLTGEFAADLIPEKFIADQVTATGWGNILNNPEVVDLSNKLYPDYSARAYKDSFLNPKGEYVVKDFNDTVTFNASHNFIKRVTPTVAVNQSDNGIPAAYFGEKRVVTANAAGEKDIIPVVDLTQTARSIYTFGNPVFIKGKSYDFLIKASEQYKFYESVQPDGTPVVKQVNGKEVVDIVPTKDGALSIYNSLKVGVGVDTASLGADGTAQYSFAVGEPVFSGGGLKDFALTIRFGQSPDIYWTWYNANKMTAFISGGKQKGTDFVTAGPDEILHVLHDPAGATSYAYIEEGSSETKTRTYTGSIDEVGNDEKVTKTGVKLEVSTGLGVAAITSTEINADAGVAIKHEEHYVGEDTWEDVDTYTTRYQTSDKPEFVGAPGDVFVGRATNITYGATDNVAFVKRSDVNPSDSVLNDPGTTIPYVVVKREGIAINESFKTLFAYPQRHIETVLIPNLIKLRNANLLPTTTVNAQTIADNLKKPVYVSQLPASDANFGALNNDTIAFGSSVKHERYDSGKSYVMYYPNKKFFSDTIQILNQFIKDWKGRLAENEQAKLTAQLSQNYSFHAGAPVEHSYQSDKNTVKSHTFNFTVGLGGTITLGANVNGTGTMWELNEELTTSHGGQLSTANTKSFTYGFVLSSDGTDDYFSVDALTSTLPGADGSFIFRTKGGASACPYEGETQTKYYQPGTVLDQATLRIEVPKIGVENAVASNVPSARPATFNLLLKNESETKSDAVYVISYVDNDSVKGATIAVDGSSIGGAGRSVIVKYGETLTKVLTIVKGPNAMDYNNIMILLHSSCQYDPTGYLENIADTVLVSAHFIPSCSDINIKSPKDKWIVNTASPVDANGKRYLPFTIDKFDVNNSLFDHIELQYKPSSASTWITSMQFFADSAKYKAAQGEKLMITNAAGINYNLPVNDAAFNDQNYDIQAVSYCKLSSADYVTTESNVVSGIKDTYFPRLFGSPQPANGVLGISDEVRLNFNETIAAGLLTYSDFQVTGIRNGVKGDHSVSVKLDGQTNYVATEFDKNLAAKSITAEEWILPSKQADQTIFSHGNSSESMELSLTSDNHLKVVVGNKTITSSKAVDYKTGEWAHVALVYNAVGHTVSALYNFVEYISNAPVDLYSATGHFEYGRSIKNSGSYFSGKMHEARVWADTLSSLQIQVNSLTQLSGAENKLLAYYPMNEGKGTILLDKAHGSNATLTGLWTTPPGKAVNLKGNNGYVKMNTSFAPISSDMDYTLELWFKGDANQKDAALASSGKGDGTDGEGSLNLFFLGFENGTLTYRNNGFEVKDTGASYLDNKWHHVAVTVNRNSDNAQLFVDGVLRKFFDAKNVGGLAAPSTYLGVRAYRDKDSLTITQFDKPFSGFIDEVRIWKTSLNQTIISNNNNVHLKGDEIGLVAYYPFEKYFVFQNNAQLGYTLSDMKIQEVASTKVPDATALNGIETDETAPVKDRGPVDNLKFDFVVNNDALIINLLEPKQAIDKTIVTFKVKNARDLNGNAILSPITWTAYIDRNQLKWSDNQLNLTKDVYAPMQFESYLVNSGGSIQHYRLDNLPAWLTASPSTGNIDPKGKQKIVFTVNEGLNVGNYDEVVYMRNDNNESEALSISLYVKGKVPDWTVTPANFKYNMNVFGKIRVNNVFSTNKEDMLGVFMNGICVGVTKNTYNAQKDFWYALLTVYSDTVRFSNLQFRIYQAGTGKTFIGIPTRPVVFSTDSSSIGTAVNPVIFDGKELVIQDITLNKNWNWISFNVTDTATNVNSLLRNGQWASGDEVKNENTDFDQYSSVAGRWAGGLDNVSNIAARFNTSLFMLKTANAQTLSISGTQADVATHPITLAGNRWSYIGYLPQVNMTLKDALAGYNASNEDVIKSQSGFAMYDPRNGWVGNLSYLEPGKGYMFYRKASADTTFKYPALNGSLTNHPARQANQLLNDLQTPVLGNYLFAQNMTVTAVIESDFVMQAGDEVFAYVNGEMRSKAVAIPNAVLKAGTFFFNIAGGQEQPVYFEIERNGEVIAESTTLFDFKANNTVGTLSKPLVIQVKKATAGITVYPNPFFNEVNINVKLTSNQNTQQHEVQVSVYDGNGKLVMKNAKETINASTYRATWNGKAPGGGELSKGVYLLNVTIDGTLHTYKLIKQ